MPGYFQESFKFCMVKCPLAGPSGRAI